jgi:hypothetical protein
MLNHAGGDAGINEISHPCHDTLAAYSVGGLAVAETTACGPHVDACAVCRAFVAEFASVRELLERVPAALVLDDPALRAGTPGAGGAIRSDAPVRRPVRRAVPIPWPPG